MGRKVESHIFEKKNTNSISRKSEVVVKRKILRLGDEGLDVFQLKEKLNLYHYILNGKLELIGKFDQKTYRAVKRFQKAHSLTQDGIVGKSTMKWLNTFMVIPWMAIAYSKIGIKEIKGKKKHNSEIVEFLNTTTNISQYYRDRDETAWCSAFVNWCLKKCGIEGTDHALAKNWKYWGIKSSGLPGSITVIKRKNANKDHATGSNTGYHVGFLLEKKRNSIKLLGGNQSNSVKISNYSLNKYEIIAHRMPKKHAFKLYSIPTIEIYV